MQTTRIRSGQKVSVIERSGGTCLPKELFVHVLLKNMADVAVDSETLFTAWKVNQPTPVFAAEEEEEEKEA